MTFLQFLATYGLTILSIIATIISLIIAMIKAKKSGNTKGMLAILEMIPNLVVTAESLFGAGKGQAKLDYVLTQLRLYALQNNIKVDINELTSQVNSVVTSTNNVNIDKTINIDKTETPIEAHESRANNNNTTNIVEDTINI